MAKIYGLPEMPIQGLRLNDIVASTQVGLVCDSTVALELNNVQINTTKGPAFTITNCKNIELNGIKTTNPQAEGPVVRMENVQDAFIHACRALPGTDSFLELNGPANRDIHLIANNLSAAKNSFVLKKGAQKQAVVER